MSPEANNARREKGGGPREGVRTRSQMETARNSGPPVEKRSDLFERRALITSAPRLQTLYKIPGYGDQLKAICILGLQTDVWYKGLNTDVLAGDLYRYFSDKLKRIAETIADGIWASLFCPPI